MGNVHKSDARKSFIAVNDLSPHKTEDELIYLHWSDFSIRIFSDIYSRIR